MLHQFGLRVPDAAGMVTTVSSTPKRKRTETIRAAGAAVSSITGVGSAMTITSGHGSTLVALTTLGVMQGWGACELLIRWRLKWRYARLHEYLVRTAATRPDDEHLRTLLVDSASTYLDDIGERLPIRPRITRTTQSSLRAPAARSAQHTTTAGHSAPGKALPPHE